MEESKNDLIMNQTEESLPQETKKTAEIAQPVTAGEAIKDYAQLAAQKIKHDLSEQVKATDFSEGSKQMAHIAATVEALNADDEENAEFLKKIKEEKQKELEQTFLTERFKEEAAKYAAKQVKAEAFYTNFRSILEFDFSHLIPKGNKTPLFARKPKNEKKGKNAVESADTETTTETTNEETRVTYKDRSYGIPLMVGMLVLLTLPYCMITIVLALFNGLNAIFNGISRFSRPAMIICGTIVGIIMMFLLVYGIMLGIDSVFGTEIISKITH